MNLITPFRFATAALSAAGRQRYRRAWRARLWNRAVASGEELLDCTLQGSLRMRVNTRDELVSRWVFLDGTFEQNQLRLMASQLKPGMCVADIGANIGVHTLVMAQSVGPSGAVHAFEPTRAFENLATNVELNSFQSRTHLNHCALGAIVGELTLMKCTAGYEALTSVGMPMISKYASGETQIVPVQTLDEYASCNKIEKFDFVKIDVEGSEPAVLQGARQLLAGHRIDKILIEVNDVCLPRCGSSAGEVLGILRAAGFQIHLLADDGSLVPVVSMDSVGMVFARKE